MLLNEILSNGDTSQTQNFSVVIPAFNSANTIANSLESCFEQTLLPSEILVIDDCSTDGTQTKVVDFLSSFSTINNSLEPRHSPDVSIFRLRTNIGAGLARDFGVRKARSEWIAFLDSDDLWYPDHLAELSHLVKSFPLARLVSTNYLEVRVHEYLNRDEIQPPITRTTIDYFLEASRRLGIVNCSTAAAHRSTILDKGGFGPWRIGEDLDLWAKIALEHPVAHSTRITSLYVRHEDGVMIRHQKAQFTTKAYTNLGKALPSVDTVSTALKEGNHLTASTSLMKYINAIVTTSIRISLVQGDVLGAKSQTRSALKKRPIFVVLVELMPTFLLSMASSAWPYIRGLVRGVAKKYGKQLSRDF